MQAVETEDQEEGTDLLSLFMSDSDEDSVKLVWVRDNGNSTKGAIVQVQGIPAVGVIDSGSEITIMGAELLAKVAVTARLHKRDFKKVDRVLKT